MGTVSSSKKNGPIIQREDIRRTKQWFSRNEAETVERQLIFRNPIYSSFVYALHPLDETLSRPRNRPNRYFEGL